MLKVLLATLGSAGDVHPYVAIGRALRERGHDVTVVTHGYFAPLVRRAGLSVVELGTVDDYEAITRVPDLAKPLVSLGAMAERVILPSMPLLYRIIEAFHRPRGTVVVANALDFGARIAQEKLGVPLATVQMHPFALRSVEQPPRFPLPLPRLAIRAVYRLIDAVVDRHLARGVNEFRASLGLSPVRRLVGGWWNSPQRVLGLFPSWYANAPDWPAQTRLTGFPLYDERSSLEMLDAVERYLDAGDAPVVVTTASWNRNGRRIFEEAVLACRRLGRRALLLTPFQEHLPPELPDGVRHFPAVPYGWLLPRAAAIVHHGGIGTAASALAAGIPQIVVPVGHDQPDNAARLVRLGVARTLSQRALRAEDLEVALEELFASQAVDARCRELSERIEKERALDETCREIESLDAGR